MAGLSGARFMFIIKKINKNNFKGGKR